jgi:hypothetical protein
MRAYYNEIDGYAAQWLRNLIEQDLIADGDVDTRSIVDVTPNDVKGYTQCHFFAGLGGWSGALRRSGIWPDHRPVWTGSCPCQPFSVAGKQGGFADERHLWSHFRYLIAQCRPATVLGEQVAAAADWVRLVRGDLEAMDYAVGIVPVEAASAGAYHLRDRLWFVAHDECAGRQRGIVGNEFGFAESCGMGNANGAGLAVGPIEDQQRGSVRSEGATAAAAGDRDAVVGVTDQCGWPAGNGAVEAARHGGAVAADDSGLGWAVSYDGKARRVESDFRLLAHGFSVRVDGLRSEHIAEAETKVMLYGQKTTQRPAKILSALWQRVLSEPSPYDALGEQAGICQAEILLAFLRKLDWSCSEGDVSLPSEKEFEEAVRSMRQRTAATRASRQRESRGQSPEQHSDSLYVLSWFLAQDAAQAWARYRRENAAPMALLENDAPNRVQKLRAFGNAIDLRPATAFVQAVSESLEGA